MVFVLIDRIGPVVTHEARMLSSEYLMRKDYLYHKEGATVMNTRILGRLSVQLLSMMRSAIMAVIFMLDSGALRADILPESCMRASSQPDLIWHHLYADVCVNVNRRH